MSNNSIGGGATAQRVRCFFEARDHVRRGICLLNAGKYDGAAQQFSEALRLNPDSAGLRPYLAQCHVGRDDYRAAASELAKVIETDPEDVTARIRHAMLLWKRGDLGEAIRSLRESVAYAPDFAELHFQLGTLLAAAGAGEEAELRFTQCLVLDGKHVEAMVSLAMCFAARHETARALSLLTRAQYLRPHDARIGHLFAMALKTVEVPRSSPRIPATMPDNGPDDDSSAVDELSRIIEVDPEFVDAFIDLPASDADESLHELLGVAVERAVARASHRADLHLQFGRVLDRLGNARGAIASIERALSIDPRSVQALIQLGRLYQKTDRVADAAERLEQAIRLGADYADVHLMLGHLYADAGQTVRARDAFHNAIRINANYDAAKTALETLAV